MKTLLYGLAMLLIANHLTAQTQPTAPAAAPSRAELERQIAGLKQQAQTEQKNIDAWSVKIRTADGEFEKRITRLTDSVKRLADSQDSGTKVLLLKQDLVAALRKTLDFYNRERGQRLAALEQQNPRMPKVELKKDVTNLDARIEERITQIMELAKSFPVPNDVPKTVYRQDGYYSGYYGWGGYEATNPEYQRQQRIGTYSEMTRTDLINALKQSIENLKRQNTNMERAAQQARTTDERDFFQQRISENRQRIDQRREQITSLLTDKTPGNRPISTKEYLTASEQMADVIADLKQDFRALLQMCNNRDVCRQRLRNIEVQIAWRERQLAGAKS
jgi:hypothetical protein